MTSELLNQKVVQHNHLIKSMAQLNRNALKVFELAVSYIDVDNPPEDNKVNISKETVYSFMHSSDRSDKETEMKRTLINLQKESVFAIDYQKKGSKRVESHVISPITDSMWNSYEPDLSIYFNSNIMPFLVQLKREFTQYPILDLIDLNSKYSIILFKWLSMHFNQYERYRHTNKRTRTQLRELQNPTIELDELRKMTNTENEYERTYDLERNVLQLATKEITEHTRLNVKYEKIKRGRKVVGFKFELSQKATRADLPYKEQDAAYLDDLSLKEVNIKEMHAEAMESPYTTILGDSLLIGLKDYQSADTMASLQKRVYPLYDKLKEKRGVEGVKTHVSYVANKRQSYDERKHNIVKYLLRSVEDYLTTVELQDLNSDK